MRRQKVINLVAALFVALLFSACSATEVGSPASNAGSSPDTDRQVLTALYHATDGPNWLNNYNWLTDSSLKYWHGVTIDGEGRVTRLELPGNELSGTIPPELGELDQLQVLDLTASKVVTQVQVSSPKSLDNMSIAEVKALSEGERDLLIDQEMNMTSGLERTIQGLSDPKNIRTSHNRLGGCIPAKLKQQLDMEASNLGGLGFC